MQRVAVVGPPCSGKSTTARHLASKLGVPHVELDGLWWEADWTEAGAARFRERVSTALAQPGWVMDGNYFPEGVAELVIPAADTIVWLDLGRWTTVPRGVRRTLQRVVLRTELWAGNREPLRYLPRMGSLTLNAIRSHPSYNRNVESLLRDPSTTHLECVRLKTTQAVREWLSSVPAPTG